MFALALIWGYNWVQMKVAVEYSPPFTFAILRIVLGALSLFLVMAWLKKPLLPQAVGGTFLLGLLQTSGLYGLATWALVSGGGFGLHDAFLDANSSLGAVKRASQNNTMDCDRP